MPYDRKKIEGDSSDEDEHGSGLAKTLKDIETDYPEDEEKSPSD